MIELRDKKKKPAEPVTPGGRRRRRRPGHLRRQRRDRALRAGRDRRQPAHMLARVNADAGEGGLVRRIGITSALQGEGVTSVCRSLALLLANDGVKRVCVVDLNWWSPSTWPDPTARRRRGHQGRRAARARPRPHRQPGAVHPARRLRPPPPAGAVLAAAAAMGTSCWARSRPNDHVLLDLPAVRTSASLTLANHADADRAGGPPGRHHRRTGHERHRGTGRPQRARRGAEPREHQGAPALLRLIPGAWVPGGPDRDVLDPVPVRRAREQDCGRPGAIARRLRSG